jgi:hypothetical protein
MQISVSYGTFTWNIFFLFLIFDFDILFNEIQEKFDPMQHSAYSVISFATVW